MTNKQETLGDVLLEIEDRIGYMCYGDGLVTRKNLTAIRNLIDKLEETLDDDNNTDD